MARMTRKQLLKQDEFTESAADFGQWLEEHWKQAVRGLIALGVLAVVIAIVVTVVQGRRDAAEGLLSRGMARYDVAQAGGFSDAAELEAALSAFEEAANKGSRSTREIAEYYRGAALYRLGRLDQAIEVLGRVATEFDSGSSLRGGTEALLATALLEAGQAGRAAEVLQGVIDAPDQLFPTEQALLQLGRIRHSEGNQSAARSAWQRIVDDYPESAAASEARRLLGS